MGDVVLGSAVFDLLRDRHPDATVDFATGELYAPLFSSDGRLGKVIRYSRSDPSAALEACAAGQYHWVIDLQNNRRSAQLVRATAARRVSRFHKLRFERFLLLTLRYNRYDQADTVVARYLKAAGLGAAEEAAYYPRIVPPATAALPPSVTLDPARPLLALIPFSAWRNKTWPLHYYEEVGRHFINKGWQTVVLGGPSDRPDAERLQQDLGDGCVSIAGLVPLDQSAAVLAGARLAVGNDTGLTHLARAVGVKTVAVFGSTTWHFGFYPFGPPPFRVLELSINCRPCHAHGGNWCYRVRRPCLTTIGPEQAVQALEALDSE
ncbi:MAG: hypothetical protein GF331_00490 [Chitinivibrionales bacterium]|nr:hypothetical protein [Chitinivibrionales bacterium]